VFLPPEKEDYLMDCVTFNPPTPSRPGPENSVGNYIAGDYFSRLSFNSCFQVQIQLNLIKAEIFGSATFKEGKRTGETILHETP
jgi:hypothetical protein